MNNSSTTNGREINKESKITANEIGSGYGGILLDPTHSELNKIQKLISNGDRKFWIINRDNHWTAIAVKDNKWYEIDSFNRDLEGKDFKDFKLSTRQKNYEKNCGQQTLAALYELFI